MKKVYIILGLIVLIVAVFLAYLLGLNKTDNVPVSAEDEDYNFSELGFVADVDGGSITEGVVFVYDKDDMPPRKLSLSFDENSICHTGYEVINCNALGISVDIVPTGKAVSLVGIEADNSVLVRKLTTGLERRYGFVREVVSRTNVLDVLIDEVEFLSNEEAIVAGIEDTDCNRENIKDCIPSLNNNFYIRNLSKEARWYKLDSDTVIRLFENPGTPSWGEYDKDKLFTDSRLQQSHIFSYPFRFAAEGELIRFLEEQYIP